MTIPHKKRAKKANNLSPVKLLLIDDQGKFKLSRKAALIEMAKSSGGEKADKGSSDKDGDAKGS